jgi:hypothetical protein
MQYKTLIVCASATALAAALACSKNSESPSAPSSAAASVSDAAADGSTLKATAPTPQSPINGAQPDSLVLVAGKSNATYGNSSTAFSYEYVIKNSSNSTVCSDVVGPISSNPVSITPSCTIEFDQPHTWQMRAALGNARGPWGATASFRSPAGGYVRDGGGFGEVFDPLTNGKSAGEINGPTQFISGTGLQLLDHSSHVTYRLPVNLQAGELSMMVLNGDEGNPGDKSKIFSMQEGPDVNDITDDDYRMTAELRGRNYGAPGAVTFRIIAGDGESRDGARIQLNFSSSRWYFWKFTWVTGGARLEVREDGPSGRVIYSQGVGGWSHPYRPDPHFIHLGSPMGRAGALDATQPGIIIKNVWASSRPRPALPGE